MSGIEFEKKGQVAYVTINRPEVMNAIDQECTRDLYKVFAEVDQDPQLRVGIITGAGDKAFSSGADLRTRHNYGPAEQGEFWRPWREGYRPGFGVGYHNTEKPWIAAINGYCLAGALELALGCDIRIASESASFGSPEVRWSILHGLGCFYLMRAVPQSSAMEMLLTGDRIDAQEALRIGLVSRVVPLPELMPTANRIAQKICDNAPVAVKVTKELAKKGYEMSLDDALRYLSTLRWVVGKTEDSVEGPKAFLQKRKPQYKGR